MSENPSDVFGGLQMDALVDEDAKPSDDLLAPGEQWVWLPDASPPHWQIESIPAEVGKVQWWEW